MKPFFDFDEDLFFDQAPQQHLWQTALHWAYLQTKYTSTKETLSPLISQHECSSVSVRCSIWFDFAFELQTRTLNCQNAKPIFPLILIFIILSCIRLRPSIAPSQKGFFVMTSAFSHYHQRNLSMPAALLLVSSFFSDFENL